MSQHSSTDSEDWEPMQSPSTVDQHISTTRFDILSLAELLEIVNEGKDSEGTPLNNSDLDAIQTRIASWRRLWNKPRELEMILSAEIVGTTTLLKKFQENKLTLNMMNWIN
ncbi:hypothetical protein V1523DRAFT_115371 [Lipomyces doorenjongii]